MGAYESKDLFQAIDSHDRRKTKKIVKSSQTCFEYVLDDSGCPPICAAAKCGYEDIIVVLLEYGFTPHVPDDRCWFPVHYAAMNGNCDVIYVLVHRGNADVTKRCPVDTCRCEKQSALHAAADHGQYKAVEALLHCGSDVTAKNYQGQTAADVAREKQFVDIADLLDRSAKLLQ